MLIDRCDLISAAIFAFRFVIEEFTVVRYVLYSTMSSLLDTFIVNHPCDVWRWFADNLNIEVERFVFAHGYIAQVSSVDLWRY